MKKRVIVIGIDGGTFDIIDRLPDTGGTPNFRKLMEGGSRALLRSTFPPMTFPAWTTFMTGVNPGMHGIFDFTEHVPGKYEISFVNAQSKRVKTIWRLMSEQGLRVAVMGVPVTYPPEKVNGVMISGFDTPVGGMATESVFHPPSLYKEFEQAIGGYRVSADVGKAIDSAQPDLALERILECLDRKIEAALYLYDKEKWDFFMALFGESDLAGHHFWRFHDPQSPFHPADTPEGVGRGIIEVYQRIDRALGKFLERLDEDTTLLVMSDHGFGGNSNRAFFINRFLEQKGLFSFLPEPFSVKALELAKRLGLKYIPHSLKVEIFRLIGSLASATESRIRFSRINWPGTTAYSEETPYFPSVWINLQGREPGGIVPESRYDEVVSSIVRELKAWVDPVTQQNVFRNVYRRSELYTGEHVWKAADILLEPNLIDGYYYLSRPSSTRPSGICLDYMPSFEMNSSASQNKSGSHRPEGIFYAFGGPFEPGKVISQAGIIDIAPTVFHLLGLPIPNQWEGRVLIEDKGLSAVSKSDETISLSSDHTGAGYSREEEEQIRERLRELGYL